MTQQQPFTVIRIYPDFELRHYPKYVLVQAAIESNFATGANLGFRPLFRFITGDNATSTKYSMTAPVIQEEKGATSQVVSFVLPDGVDEATVPLPRDGTVTITRVAPHEAAVQAFSGGWKEKRVRERASRLLIAVRREGLSPRGTPYFARFDPPWKPGFLKHNEVLVRLDSTE
ncbi:hypothetical protein GY21_11030 [Cryobacterium roopkundense]|uniref:Heme-binding protein n=1 Tax=Cryobacterium roopkundense TaxID=1001240 RepID=A0A099J606_9MICO|nr:heme-binding protein [Cryobacterium roopkundense]KGJ73500.1 hypothetical protein GY21_11030 [Cryobacterium roopkundense]MBB5641540.1 hypothetical protein [Cryobacterium roopkundense]